jgi:hypothetical protein
MDFRFTAEQEAWRREVRQFLKENPAEKFPVEGVDEGYGCGATSSEFGRLLGSKGWISMTWPKEYGGQGRPLMDVLILLEEMAYARAPWYGVLFNFTTGNMLIKIGSDELKKELLSGVAKGEECFWLAMSEPDAGSDLLSLRTQAVEKEDCWVVNGQKTWASLADLARLGLLYTKTETDPNISKAKTITMFLLDKNLPGVTVRPLINLAGDITHNEVFLDDVRIPKKYLLGQKNKGFIHMLEGLDFDRFWGRFIKPPFCKSVIEDLVRYAKETRRDGTILANDPMVRHKLAESAIETETCRLIFWNAGWKMCNGLPFSMDSALGKIMADEMGQRLFNKGMQIMGPYSQLGEATKWAPLRAEIQKWYLCSLGHTIAGGTSEIIRNTIATVGLGLPR